MCAARSYAVTLDFWEHQAKLVVSTRHTSCILHRGVARDARHAREPWLGPSGRDERTAGGASLMCYQGGRTLRHRRCVSLAEERAVFAQLRRRLRRVLGKRALRECESTRYVDDERIESDVHRVGVHERDEAIDATLAAIAEDSNAAPAVWWWCRGETRRGVYAHVHQSHETNKLRRIALLAWRDAQLSRKQKRIEDKALCRRFERMGVPAVSRVGWAYPHSCT